MKITSDTLYHQWRSITSLGPERCDPRWIDLNLCPISDPTLLAEVETCQAEPTHCDYGYAYFLAEMGELASESQHSSIPRINAGHLALKYQRFFAGEDSEYFYDYMIVPKVSRLSPLYVSPDYDFPVILAATRFTQTTVNKGNSSTNSKRYQTAYDEEIPEVTDRPKRTRRGKGGTAEQEWIGLNLLANYRYTKETVQLLYMPTSGTLYSDALASDAKILTAGQINAMAEPITTPKLTQQDLAAKHVGVERWHSDLLVITANDILAGSCDALLSGLKIKNRKGFSPEQYTDAVAGRDLTEDGAIAEIRADKKLEAEQAIEEGIVGKFIFSENFPTLMRHASPKSLSRQGDSNPDYLFGHGPELDPVNTPRITVFDVITEAFVSRTLEEWQTDCRLDDIALMPLHLIPDLLNRGLSADDILYLSTHINEATPNEQAQTMITEFINSEAQVNLR